MDEGAGLQYDAVGEGKVGHLKIPPTQFGSGRGVGDHSSAYNSGGRGNSSSLISSSVVELFTSRMVSCPERLCTTIIISRTYSIYPKITLRVPLN